jgi:DNA processing protein
MSVSERAGLLTLLRMPGRSWSQVADEVEAAGSALAVLRAGGPPGQGDLLAETDDPDVFVEEAEEEIKGWEHQGMRFITLLDSDYPAQLLTVHQRPPFLMTRGTLSQGDVRGVAIVGTRKASEGGTRVARKLAIELARAGIPVVSGLAAGIDAAALGGALSENGRAVAVIGTGLRQSYPKENAEMQERIAQVGLLLSQFLPDTPPTQKTFPMRNAVMSGYSSATVVVEAPFKSGARMQARLALEHGRKVFLLESLMRNDWAREYATRANTTVVRSVEDVLEGLQPTLLDKSDLVRS